MRHLTPTCSCCGGYKRVVLLAPQRAPAAQRLRPQRGDKLAPTLACVDCDRMNLWPTAYRLRGMKS